MKKILLIFTGILILSFVLSCNKNKVIYGSFTTNVIHLRFLDKDNNNLISNGYYDFNDFWKYYVIDSETYKICANKFDYPKGIALYTNGEDNWISLDLNTNTDPTDFNSWVSLPPNDTIESITYLELNKDDTDTIFAKLFRGDNWLILEEFWYNGKYIKVDADTTVYNIVK